MPYPLSGVKARSARSAVSVTICAMLKGYQMVTWHRLSPCRYWPTCSQYALEAVELHGPWRGLDLAIRRVCRCRPGGGWGVDAVPLEGGSR